MITEQQKTYFDAMEVLFATPGWKLHLDDLKGNMEALKNSILGLSTIEQFYIAKGRFQVLNELLSFEDFLTKTKVELQSQEDENVIV